MGSNDVPLNDITGPLSDRQHEVLSLIALGEDHASIAGRFKLGRAAISQDVRRIVIKTESRSTMHAVAVYAQEGTLRRLSATLPAHDDPAVAYNALIAEAAGLKPEEAGINPVHSAALYAEALALNVAAREILTQIIAGKRKSSDILPHVARTLGSLADARRPECYGPVREPATAAA